MDLRCHTQVLEGLGLMSLSATGKSGKLSRLFGDGLYGIITTVTIGQLASLVLFK